MEEERLYKKIIETYMDTESVKRTAQELNTSVVKVRKVLITEGLWSSRTSLEIQEYLNQGKTTAEIAKLLFTTEKAVQQYLPYTRGIYNSDNPTVSAINSANYRERIRIAKEKTLRRSIYTAAENKWLSVYADLMNKQDEERNGLMGTKERDADRYLKMVLDNAAILSGAPVKKSIHQRKEFPGVLELPPDTDPDSIKDVEGAIRLNLRLVRSDYFSEEEKDAGTRILQEYGDVKYGDTVSRDILVPGNMPLWALHYTIQKCFGWQNTHLHCFTMPYKTYETITDNNFGKYADLVGVVFRSPWMNEEEEFWQDDYDGGSVKNWLRSKYTGPYLSMCHGEGIWQCRADIARMKEAYAYVEVDHCYRSDGYDYYDHIESISKEEYEVRVKQEPIETHEDSLMRSRVIKEVFAFDDMPLDVHRWICAGKGENLLERLEIEEAFCIRKNGINGNIADGQKIPASYDSYMDEEMIEEVECCEDVDDPNMQPYINPVSDVIYYQYDFGDGWCVEIRASYDAVDLIESGRVTQAELDAAVVAVYQKFRPVCIAQDGYPVLDDVGGISGYLDFLEGINRKAQCGSRYEDAKDSLEWAKSLGWSKRKLSNKNLL